MNYRFHYNKLKLEQLNFILNSTNTYNKLIH